MSDNQYTKWLPALTLAGEKCFTCATRVCTPRGENDQGPVPLTDECFDSERRMYWEIVHKGLTVDPRDFIRLFTEVREGDLRIAHPREFRSGDIVEVDLTPVLIPTPSNKYRMKLVLRQMVLLKSRFDYVSKQLR